MANGSQMTSASAGAPPARAEFGDFQTPRALADRVCALLAARGVRPASVLEPTCGTGSFLHAAVRAFPSARRLLGLDINPGHVARARNLLGDVRREVVVRVRRADMFRTDWNEVLAGLPGPLLVLGNPPWVTSAELGALGSSNLPARTNVHGHRGIEAITGKGNFDISEWLLLRALDWIEGRDANLAVLCKVAVARRVLRNAWRRGRRVRNAEIHRIDANEHFGAAVDAGLFTVRGSPSPGEADCAVHDALESPAPSSRFGLCGGELVADLGLHDRWRHVSGPSRCRWRSGVKHDCSKVMELRRRGPDSYVNGFGERVELESRFLHPMLKASELANGTVAEPTRWMLVTQSAIGEDTARIESEAPRTWSYLRAHADRLDRRGSAVYRNRPRFSVFGVGPYAFAPWRVAISGFHKELGFRVVGPYEGRPVVLDDTSYFVPCASEAEARLVHGLLGSEPARGLLNSLAFWDSKRPVTAGLLGRLDLLAVAREVGRDDALLRFLDSGSREGEQLELL